MKKSNAKLLLLYSEILETIIKNSNFPTRLRSIKSISSLLKFLIENKEYYKLVENKITEIYNIFDTTETLQNIKVCKIHRKLDRKLQHYYMQIYLCNMFSSVKYSSY